MICPFQGKDCNPEICALGVTLDRGEEHEEMIGCALTAMAESLWDIASDQAAARDNDDDELEEDCTCADENGEPCPACETMKNDDDHEIDKEQEND